MLAGLAALGLLVTKVLPMDTTGEPEYGRHYSFLHVQPGTNNTPIGFDPCLGLNIVVNDTGWPDVGTQLVTEAAAELSAACLLYTSRCV